MRKEKRWARRQRPLNKLLRRLRHAAEGLAHLLAMGLFWLLPVDWASGFAGWGARTLARSLGVNRRAMQHLAIAFPEMSEAQHREILIGMWDNLGRTVAEYPHLGTIAAANSGRVEVVGSERLAAVRRDGGHFILLAAHMANFELMPVIAHKQGYDITVVVRRINNPYIERVTQYFRSRPNHGKGLISKSRDGARQVVKLLDEGFDLGVLFDQRSSQGVPLPLFGRPARTTLGIAKQAIDRGIPMFPVQFERLGGARFRISVEPPIERPNLGSKQADAEAMMAAANKVLERWIRERPADWLWLHRRWDRPTREPRPQPQSEVSA